MPPEQARNEGADRRADVFGAALTIYELMTDERFYSGVPEHLLTATVATGGHVPRHWDDLDGDIQAVLSSALHPDRDARTPTAADVADGLRACAAKRGMRIDAANIRMRMRQLFSDQRDPWTMVEEHTPPMPRLATGNPLADRSKSLQTRHVRQDGAGDLPPPTVVQPPPVRQEDKTREKSQSKPQSNSQSQSRKLPAKDQEEQSMSMLSVKQEVSEVLPPRERPSTRRMAAPEGDVTRVEKSGRQKMVSDDPQVPRDTIVLDQRPPVQVTDAISRAPTRPRSTRRRRRRRRRAPRGAARRR
jgi:hypothetical protein